MNDITYSAADVSVYSVLEPTLGIINVCLPTIRPAMLALAGKDPRKGHSVAGYSSGKNSSWNYQSKGSGPASKKRSRLQGSGEDTEFDRLDDEFPLTTLVEGAGPRSGAAITAQNPGEITIERRWEVKGHHSDPTSGAAQ